MACGVTDCVLRCQTEEMVARQSDTSIPQNLVSAGYPSRCQPGDRDFTSDEKRMGSSISLGGGGRPESRPVSMPLPAVKIRAHLRPDWGKLTILTIPITLAQQSQSALCKLT